MPGPWGDHRPLDDPARSTGIIGLIFSISGIFCFFVAIIGIVVSTMAFVRSRREGFRNAYALAGILVGAAFFLTNLVLTLPWLIPVIQQGG